MPTSSLAHIRLGSLIVLLFVVDSLMAYYSIQYVLTQGKSVVMLFAFEFWLLCVTALNVACRFVMHVMDIRLPNGLVSKGVLTMVVDLLCDTVRFVTYIFFVILVC